MTPTFRFRIEFAPMQFSDSQRQQEHDLKVVLKRNPHLMPTTEIDSRLRPLAYEVGKEMGYELIVPHNYRHGSSHSPVFVRRDLEVVGRRYRVSIPGGADEHGRYSSRGPTSVTVRYRDNLITLVNGHWLATWSDEDRWTQNLGMTRDFIDVVQAAAKNRRLAFWTGDLNIDRDDSTRNLPLELLARGGLKSAYAALGKPDIPTHGRRHIDEIGYYRGDARVKPVWIRVHDDQPTYTFTDHFQGEAAFEIRP